MTPTRTVRAARICSGVTVPALTRATAASEAIGISPLNRPVRSTPRRAMAANQVMNTIAVTATAR